MHVEKLVSNLYFKLGFFLRNKWQECMDPYCFLLMGQAAAAASVVMGWGILSWHTLGITAYLSTVADHGVHLLTAASSRTTNHVIKLKLSHEHGNVHGSVLKCAPQSPDLLVSNYKRLWGCKMNTNGFEETKWAQMEKQCKVTQNETKRLNNLKEMHNNSKAKNSFHLLV